MPRTYMVLNPMVSKEISKRAQDKIYNKIQAVNKSGKNDKIWNDKPLSKLDPECKELGLSVQRV